MSRARFAVNLVLGSPKQTPRKHAVDVLSVGERLPPWARDSVKFEIKFHHECKLRFPRAQFKLRKMHRTNLSVSIEAKYWDSGLRFNIWRTSIRPIKTASNSWCLSPNGNFVAILSPELTRDSYWFFSIRLPWRRRIRTASSGNAGSTARTFGPSHSTFCLACWMR